MVFAASLSLVRSDSDSICYSYGVDFVDEGHYFINSQSSEQFTAVSYFKGCNDDVADVLLVAPDSDEYLCSQIPTQPDDVNQLSTCPIQKSQMPSGDWLLLILGNNGDGGQPFAWQRGKAHDSAIHYHFNKCRSVPYNRHTSNHHSNANSDLDHYYNTDADSNRHDYVYRCNHHGPLFHRHRA